MDPLTIEAARRGDRAAQASLLRALQDVWFRFSLSLLGRDPEAARDAAQETALRFLRDLHRFRGASSITTWSLGIALNVSREMRRQRGRGGASLDDEQAPEPASDQAGESSDRPALRREARELLWRHLGALPQRQREALLLRFFEDQSVEATAASMGCAQGTVKATVHQALRALREKLKPVE